MLSKLRSKTTIESLDSRSDDVKVAQEGRVLVMMEQIENRMKSPIQQQGNLSNSPIEQVEEWGVGNVDVSILLSINSNEFQVLVQELKSQ